MEVYEYRGYHDCESKCGLEIYRQPSKSVMVVVTELDDNPGTSITNVAEHLATAVCRDKGISPQKLTWVEHYPLSRFNNGPHWSIVTFDFDWQAGRFTNPDWVYVKPEEIEALKKRMIDSRVGMLDG